MLLSPALALLLMVACQEDDVDSGAADTDDSEPTAADGGTETDDDTDDEPDYDTDHSDEIGEIQPDFSLVDINPSSVTYGQQISSLDLAGRPYSLIFLDSRCGHVPDVADDLWGAYLERPDWWEDLPLYGVQSRSASETMPDSVVELVDSNDLPILQDTAEQDLWYGYMALNHDFFAISEDGALDAWLPLYFWPDDLETWRAYMTQRFDTETTR